MQPRHDSSRLDRFLEVRTSRDVVGDWGAEFPRRLVLADPGVRSWDLSGLHNLERQNALLESQGWSSRAVDDPSLAPALPCSEALPGLAGLPRRVVQAWRRLRSEEAPAGQSPAVPRRTTPRIG